MHIPQSWQSHEELLQLAAVPTQIISPREAKPIISVVQDIVLGLYRMTKPNIQLTEKQLFNLMVTNPKCTGFVPAPTVINGEIKRWTGRQLLSTIIPKKINVDMKTGQYNENKTKEENANHVITIKNGEIISGTFDKEVYQARTKGLVHSIYNEYGPDETRIFFDNTQKMICNWLVLNGFSVGISDLVVEEESIKEFETIIRDMKVKVYDVIRKIHQGIYENQSTKSTSMEFEREVNNLLNQAVKSVGDKGAQQIDENYNRLINMIKSKSKGSTINVSQMIGCLGQQNVDGRRIPYGFDYRTLPHYTKYDDGPESRGFVENSFINGLTPQEFFFHAMGGREGLIDTAVQTFLNRGLKSVTPLRNYE
jgi:DNA-directed RNA polymerase II subunit RPB1